MSLKTSIDKIFLIDLLLITNYFLHNKTKNPGQKKMLNHKINKLTRILKANKEDIEYGFLYLKHNGIIFEDSNYLFINLDILKKMIRNAKKTDGSNVIIQSNFELMIKPELDLKSFFTLIQFAELKNKDVVYRFMITENSLHNAFVNKITVRMIKDVILQNSDLNKIPHNVEYFIDDVYKRIGEIKLGLSSGYIIAKGHILKMLVHDKRFKDSINKLVSSTTGLLKSDINLWDFYFELKNNSLFPIIEVNKVEKNSDHIHILFNEKEVSTLLTAFYTLKDIGFEHHIKIDFHLLNNLINNIEKKMDFKHISKSAERSVRYRQELKHSIKSYVLKSLKASISLPKNLVLNTISAHYKGENPATIKKDIIKMIEFCIKNKLKFSISYSSFSNKKNEHIIEGKYLYDNSIVYFINCLNKKEENIEINKIVFTALL